jgi:hypothetical protein
MTSPCPAAWPAPRAVLGLVGLLALHACQASGQGCGVSLAAYPSPPPAGGELQPHAGVAHLTDGALALARRELATALSAALPVAGGLVVLPLDESLLPAGSPVGLRDGCLGPNLAGCASPTFASTVSVDLSALADGLSLAWLDASAGGPGLSVTAHDLGVDVDLALVVPAPSGGTAVCHVHAARSGPAFGLSELGLALHLGVDTSAGAPHLVLAPAAVTSPLFVGSQVDLVATACDGASDPACVDAACTADPVGCADACATLELVLEPLGTLSPALALVVDQLGRSVGAAAGSVVTRLLAVVPLSLAAQVSGTAGLGAPLVVGLSASGEPSVSGAGSGRGLDLPSDVGITSVLPGGVTSLACGPEGSPPGLAALAGATPAWPAAVALATTDAPYELALALSQASFTQLGWTLYQGGALCQTLRTDEAAGLGAVPLSLTAGLLATFDPALAGLAPADSPLLVVTRPTQPPTLTLGAGTTDDSLVHLGLDDLGVDLYLFVDDAFVRLAGLTLDLTVDLGLAPADTSAVAVTLAAIHLGQVRGTYGELAPSADVPALVSLAADLALSAGLTGGTLLSFDLAGALGGSTTGFTPRALALRRELDGDGHAFLATYLALCTAADLSDPTRPGCSAPIASAVAQASPTAMAAARSDATVFGRLDGGAWRALPDGTASLASASGAVELVARGPDGTLSTVVSVQLGPAAPAATAPRGCATVFGPWPGVALLGLGALRRSRRRA